MRTDVDGVARTVSMFEAAKHYYTESVEWTIGTSVEYSVYVEVGTSTQQAQPYLRPALKQVKSRADAIVEKHDGDLEAALKDIATQIEAEAKRRCPVDTGNLRSSIKAERTK